MARNEKLIFSTFELIHLKMYSQADVDKENKNLIKKGIERESMGKRKRKKLKV